MFSSRHNTVFATRLTPGQDLKTSLLNLAKEKQLTAGYIITCVGSLKQARLRMSDSTSIQDYKNQCFEIVSLVGTLSQDGVHLHLSLSDTKGKCIGGHMMEGCEIYTTAEVVIGEAADMVFERIHDEETGFKELHISSNK